MEDGRWEQCGEEFSDRGQQKKVWKMDVKWKFISDCQHETKIVAGNASVDIYIDKNQ